MNKPSIKDELFKEYSFHIQDISLTTIADKNTKYAAVKSENKGKDQLHFHSYFELFLVSGEELTIEFEDGEHDFKKNTLIIIPPLVNHQTIIKSRENSRYNISFLMERNSLNVNLLLFDALSQALKAPYIALQAVPEICKTVVDTVQSIELGDELRIPFNFHKLITEILEHSDIYSVLPKMREIPFSDSNMVRGYKLQTVIYRHYKDDISLEFIAEKLFLSTRQTSRLINKFYGCTYRELITKMRMKAAAELLQSEDMTVLEVASYVGYTSVKGFYSAFKSQYGCLPAEFRKTKRSK